MVWLWHGSRLNRKSGPLEAFHISQSRIDASVVAIHELTDGERRLPLTTLAKMHPSTRTE